MDKFKIGDVIRVIKVTEDDDDTSLRVGYMGIIRNIDFEIVDVDLFDNIELEDDGARNINSDGTYALYLDQIEVVQVPNIGDKILIVESNNRYGHYCETNSLVTVKKISVDIDEVEINKISGTRQIITFEDFKTIPFQLGDKVKCNRTSPEIGDYFGINSEMISDNILTIVNILYSEPFESLCYEVVENAWSYHPDWLTLVTEIEKIADGARNINSDDFDELISDDTLLEIEKVGEIKRMLRYEGFTDDECMQLIFEYFIHKL